MTRRGMLSFVLAICGVLSVVGVASAQAAGSDGSIPARLTGPCQVTATINGTGTTIDPSSSGGVYTVPLSGSANYSGSIAVPAEERFAGGSVWVVTPPGIPSFTIKSWEDPVAETVGDTGEVSWDLPGALPRGIIFTVEGVHNDTATCTGAITVKVEGGITDSPVGLASVALTLVTAAVLGFAAIPRGL
ncbi:MAG: hypothetical protein O2798_02450 [Chloroflexi bacterium]|nr:hypothetical protein [Chloroflexota bacterium]MDA1239683.1 hypothetical protein [Chloroflexota bacterium]